MLKVEQMSAGEAAGDRRSAVGARAGTVGAVFLAVLLGTFLVWGAGFAGPSVLHNAAHDARHANGFPCH